MVLVGCPETSGPQTNNTLRGWMFSPNPIVDLKQSPCVPLVGPVPETGTEVGVRVGGGGRRVGLKHWVQRPVRGTTGPGCVRRCPV